MITREKVENFETDIDDAADIVNGSTTVTTRLGGDKESLDQLLSKIVVGEVAVYSAATTYTDIDDWVEYSGVVYRPLPSELPIGPEAFDSAKWSVAQNITNTDASEIDVTVKGLSRQSVDSYLNNVAPHADYATVRALDSSELNDGDYLWVEGFPNAWQVKTGTKTDSGWYLVFDDDSNRYAESTAKKVYPEIFGVTWDGSTDDTSNLQAADTFARTENMVLYLNGSARTTSTLNLTAAVIEVGKCFITKDLDDTEVIRIKGGLSGGGSFSGMYGGELRAGQNSSPSTAQTSAHAFVFDNVVNTTFNVKLNATHCAYAFANDETSGLELSWGNNFSNLVARGCVQGYFHWPYGGSGAHTENFVQTAYLNGKEFGDPALLPKNDNPIYLQNAEGFKFGTLNIEWTDPNTDFIRLDNESTLQVGAFHFEGNEWNNSSDGAIVRSVNSGSVRTNFFIENLHLNGNTQTAGTLSLSRTDSSTAGKGYIGAFSGNDSTNTWTDFRAINTSGPFCLELGKASGYQDYITSVQKGSATSDFDPQLYTGAQVYENLNSLSNTGATIDVGKATYVRLTGTPTASLATINFDAVEGERDRDLVIENDASTLTITSTGNINKPADASWDLSIATNRKVFLRLNINDSKADIIGYT